MTNGVQCRLSLRESAALSRSESRQSSHVSKRRCQQFLLLDRMAAFRAGGGTGGAGAADAGEGEAVEQPLAQVDAEEPPGAHVLRLFLHPVDRCSVGVVGQSLAEQVARQWIELLDTQ